MADSSTPNALMPKAGWKNSKEKKPAKDIVPSIGEISLKKW